MDIFSLQQGLLWGTALFWGLCLGSFLTCIPYRLMRGISLWRDDAKGGSARSKCPSCHHVLMVADLVPVLSWVASRGRCRHCGAPIGGRYPLMELATAIIVLACVWVWGFSIKSFLLSLFLSALLAFAVFHPRKPCL